MNKPTDQRQVAIDRLNLSYVKRWVVAPMYREQSVAEHTFRVLAIARYIYKSALPDNHDGLWGFISMACMDHDVEEVYSGDVPGPQKDATGLSWPPPDSRSKAIVKVADSVETGTWGVVWGMRTWNHKFNAYPKRDVAKIAFYSSFYPEILAPAEAIWKEITGQPMSNWR